MRQLASSIAVSLFSSIDFACSTRSCCT